MSNSSTTTEQIFDKTRYVLSAGTLGDPVNLSQSGFTPVVDVACIYTSDFETNGTEFGLVAFNNNRNVDFGYYVLRQPTTCTNVIANAYFDATLAPAPSANTLGITVNTLGKQPCALNNGAGYGSSYPDMTTTYDQMVNIASHGFMETTTYEAGSTALTGTLVSASVPVRLESSEIDQSALQACTTNKLGSYQFTKSVEPHHYVTLGGTEVKYIEGTQVTDTSNTQIYDAPVRTMITSSNPYTPLFSYLDVGDATYYSSNMEVSVRAQVTVPQQATGASGLLLTLNVYADYMNVADDGSLSIVTVYGKQISSTSDITSTAPGSDIKITVQFQGSFTAPIPPRTSTVKPAPLVFLGVRARLLSTQNGATVTYNTAPIFESSCRFYNLVKGYNNQAVYQLLTRYDGPVHVERHVIFNAVPNPSQINILSNSLMQPTPIVRTMVANLMWKLFGASMGAVLRPHEYQEYLNVLASESRLKALLSSNFGHNGMFGASLPSIQNVTDNQFDETMQLAGASGWSTFGKRLGRGLSSIGKTVIREGAEGAVEGALASYGASGRYGSIAPRSYGASGRYGSFHASPYLNTRNTHSRRARLAPQTIGAYGEERSPVNPELQRSLAAARRVTKGFNTIRPAYKVTNTTKPKLALRAAILDDDINGISIEDCVNRVVRIGKHNALVMDKAQAAPMDDGMDLQPSTIGVMDPFADVVYPDVQPDDLERSVQDATLKRRRMEDEMSEAATEYTTADVPLNYDPMRIDNIVASRSVDPVNEHELYFYLLKHGAKRTFMKYDDAALGIEGPGYASGAAGFAQAKTSEPLKVAPCGSSQGVVVVGSVNGEDSAIYLTLLISPYMTSETDAYHPNPIEIADFHVRLYVQKCFNLDDTPMADSFVNALMASQLLDPRYPRSREHAALPAATYYVSVVQEVFAIANNGIDGNSLGLAILMCLCGCPNIGVVTGAVGISQDDYIQIVPVGHIQTKVQTICADSESPSNVMIFPYKNVQDLAENDMVSTAVIMNNVRCIVNGNGIFRAMGEGVKPIPVDTFGEVLNYCSLNLMDMNSTQPRRTSVISNGHKLLKLSKYIHLRSTANDLLQMCVGKLPEDLNTAITKLGALAENCKAKAREAPNAETSNNFNRAAKVVADILTIIGLEPPQRKDPSKSLAKGDINRTKALDFYRELIVRRKNANLQLNNARKGDPNASGVKLKVPIEFDGNAYGLGNVITLADANLYIQYAKAKGLSNDSLPSLVQGEEFNATRQASDASGNAIMEEVVVFIPTAFKGLTKSLAKKAKASAGAVQTGLLQQSGLLNDW